VRFWGKIFGTDKDYLIAECEMRDGAEDVEDEEDADAANDQEAAHGDDEQAEDADGNADAAQANDGDAAEDAPPQSQYKPPKDLPREVNAGVNKYVYFACNAAGDAWTRLPPVKPKHVALARQIRKFFTGHLSAPVQTFPPFPGTEAHLLRAQIARISAATHVSPVGYYVFDENEDVDEDAPRESFIKNEEYEGIAVEELTSPELANWVHHVQYLLPQGRCSWVNPKQDDEDAERDEEDEEGDGEEREQPEPETGPVLLSPLSEDAELDAGVSAWSVRTTSGQLPAYSSAVIASNRWPGAYAYAVGKQFGTVYVGWGLKYALEPYTPPLPEPVQSEYADVAAVTEGVDPTVEEEEAAKPKVRVLQV
jgi:radial spoke head protein 4/6